MGKKSPTNDTPHLQGFIYFKNERAFNPVRKMLHGASIRPVRCVEALIKYCKKEGDFYEFGTCPRQGVEVLEKKKNRII